MRHRGIIALGLLALPLAGCAPLPEVVNWDQWARGIAADAGITDLYNGNVVGGTVDDGGMLSYNVGNLFSNVERGPSVFDMHCRSPQPVTFRIGDGDPVTVDCAEGGSVELPLEASTEVVPEADGRAYWLVVVNPLPEPIDCDGCEADAFVDGVPADGSVEGSQEP